jgi:hypothetical protein
MQPLLEAGSSSASLAGNGSPGQWRCRSTGALRGSTVAAAGPVGVPSPLGRRAGLAVVGMVAGRLGRRLGHVAAPLCLAVIAVAWAVVDLAARVHPDLAWAATRSGGYRRGGDYGGGSKSNRAGESKGQSSESGAHRSFSFGKLKVKRRGARAASALARTNDPRGRAVVAKWLDGPNSLRRHW